MDSSLFFNITTAAYFVAMVVFIIYLTSKNEQIGFGATIFCYLGVNLLLSGLHSYGS